MFKRKIQRKIKLISLITLLVISLLSPIVNAENETNAEQAVPISVEQEETTIKDGDLYLCQDNVTVDQPVDGNLFIIAKTVTINSQIGGDAFICANSINIEENGYILSNLFALSDNINVKGSVYNIYSMGNSLTIDGFVYRDVKTICNSFNLNGMIGRNVFVDCSNINFKEKSENAENSNITSYGTVQGNLNYSSNKEITIPDGAVSGEINFTTSKTNGANISTYIYSLGALLVSVLIIWLIGLWLSPKILHNTNKDMSLKKALQIIGLGILVPLVITLLAAIILLIPITSQLSIILLCILAILFFISTSITIININYLVCNKFNIAKNLYKLGFLIITTIVFWLLTLIPYVGAVISIISIIWGIGNISYKFLIKEKDDKKIQSTSDSKDEVKKVKKANSENVESNEKGNDK